MTIMTIALVVVWYIVCAIIAGVVFVRISPDNHPDRAKDNETLTAVMLFWPIALVVGILSGIFVLALRIVRKVG